MSYVAPTLGKDAFTCPHCGAYARQYQWGYKPIQHAEPIHKGHNEFPSTVIRMSMCEHCKALAIWHGDSLVWPDLTSAPSPNPDCPPDVKKDFLEAASVLSRSPRGAAALLRLAIQRLCIHLGGSGENVNDDIAKLVSEGLPRKIQQSLDVVRVTGNSAVHPGQIEMDDADTAARLFPLVNLIVEYMVSMPKKVDGLYDSLPDSSKGAIERRDKKLHDV